MWVIRGETIAQIIANPGRGVVRVSTEVTPPRKKVTARGNLRVVNINVITYYAFYFSLSTPNQIEGAGPK